MFMRRRVMQMYIFRNNRNQHQWRSMKRQNARIARTRRGKSLSS
jgi:hypothetical protein